MANFIPFKAYILSMLDEFIRMYEIREPFLDIGCGKGDVALHLARKGWHGDAIDTTIQAVEVTKQLLQTYPQVNVAQKSIEEYRGVNINLVLLLDVLEHIDDDMAILKAIANVQLPGAYLVITVPSNPDKEWRWDDELYGHLRRYSPNEIKQLLGSCEYRVIEIWDITYPIFWLLRRLYTSIKRPPRINESALERTYLSPFTNAWELGWISNVLSKPTFWGPVFKIQKKYRNRLENGHEMMVIARRNDS